METWLKIRGTSAHVHPLQTICKPRRAWGSCPNPATVAGRPRQSYTEFMLKDVDVEGHHHKGLQSRLQVLPLDERRPTLHTKKMPSTQMRAAGLSYSAGRML